MRNQILDFPAFADDAAIQAAQPPAPGKRTRASRLPPRDQPPGALDPEGERCYADATVLDAAFQPDRDGATDNGGLPIPRALLHYVGALTGVDLSSVRAQQSALPSSVGAVALAQGNELHFAPGQYDPRSHAGLELLAHELVHVAQQARGQVRSDSHLAGLDLATDAAQERDADDLGRRAVSMAREGAALAPAPGAPARFTGSAPAQRKLATWSDIPIDESGRATWSSLHMPLDDDGVAVGRGAVARHKNQARNWTTEVTWKESQYGDGVEMSAKLGPDHGLGSKPGNGAKASWNRRVAALHRAAGGTKTETKHYIAGHLLSEQLGGPGDDERNLTPIPRDANAQHLEHVERHVKHLVNDLHAWVHYQVEVSHSDEGKLKYPSSLTCTWWQLAPTTETGAKVPGTEARRTITIAPPSTYGSGQAMAKTDDKRNENAEKLSSETATTELELGDMILDIPAKIKARALVMGPLIEEIKQRKLQETDNAKELLAAATPSEEELTCYAEIVELSGTDVTKEDTQKAISEALQKLTNLRTLRNDRAGKVNAPELREALTSAIKSEQRAHDAMASLVAALLKAAASVEMNAESQRAAVRGHVDKLRGWLGEPPLPKDMIPSIDTLLEVQDSKQRILGELGRHSLFGKRTENFLDAATSRGMEGGETKQELIENLSTVLNKEELQAVANSERLHATLPEYVNMTERLRAKDIASLPDPDLSGQEKEIFHHLRNLALSTVDLTSTRFLASLSMTVKVGVTTAAMKEFIRLGEDALSCAQGKEDASDEEADPGMEPRHPTQEDDPTQKEATTSVGAAKRGTKARNRVRHYISGRGSGVTEGELDYYLKTECRIRRADVRRDLLKELRDDQTLHGKVTWKGDVPPCPSCGYLHG